jgi:hypothetical protein
LTKHPDRGKGCDPDLQDGDKSGEPEINHVDQVGVGNAFGEIDGSIESNVQPHAFTDKGKTGDATWHHCGGTGGKGNEPTGEAKLLVAPVHKTKPTANGKPAKAWVKKGTGTVKVEPLQRHPTFWNL